MNDHEQTVKALVIDDDASFRALAVAVLSTDDRFAEVRTAEDAESGLAALADSPATVVLLDVQLPGMDGLTALPVLRATLPDARVVLWSAVMSAEIRRRGYDAGAACCFDKSAMRITTLPDVLAEALAA